MIAWEGTGSGGWNPEMAWMFEKRPRPVGRTPAEQREVDRLHRLANIEEFRARERERARRHRERVRAAA